MDQEITDQEIGGVIWITAALTWGATLAAFGVLAFIAWNGEAGDRPTFIAAACLGVIVIATIARATHTIATLMFGALNDLLHGMATCVEELESRPDHSKTSGW